MNPSQINAALAQHDEVELHEAEESGFGADVEEDQGYQDEHGEYDHDDC